MYGYLFPKEDHIALVELIFELLKIPDLEPWVVYKVASVGVNLLRKRELILPDELTIEWKPLYELYEKLFHTSEERLGLIHIPQ